jgi:xylulokinase
MNLWDIRRGAWHEELIDLASGPQKLGDLVHKLGEVHENCTQSIGTISRYMIDRYGFPPSCSVAAFTGDNPATILALPLRSNDAIVSLGTSTTFLMSTHIYAPDPATHFFNHPTTPGLHMFMLCYKNGGLARERVRDAVNALPSSSVSPASNPWSKFDRIASSTPILGQKAGTNLLKLGLYFPQPEIVPNVRAGEWHFDYDSSTSTLIKSNGHWNSPTDDVRAILESQFLSLRLRSRSIVTSPTPNAPPQPRRVYLVGGGSQNRTIAKVAGEVLGGTDGMWKLDVGENACALGAAYKAVWTVERQEGESFEELIGKRWNEGEFAERVAEGYEKVTFEKYGVALNAFEMMEETVKRGST